jgi:hypothetical protein
MYANRKFTTVQQIGYFSKGDIFGFSPDGLVGEEGLIEIKTFQNKAFVAYSLTHTIDPKHLAQIQWGLWITGRKWCDFLVFNSSPKFKNQLLVDRFLPNPATFKKFDKMAKIYETAFLDGMELLS